MKSTHISKYNSTSRFVSSRRIEWYMGYLYKFLRQIGPTTGSKFTIIYEKFLKKKLNRHLSFSPPIGPQTHANHGADSAALLPGCMRNKFWCFCCSGVSGRQVWRQFCEAQISPQNCLHLDPFISLHPPKLPPSLLSSSPNCHQLTDCCVGPGRHCRVGRSPIVVVIIVAATIVVIATVITVPSPLLCTI